MSKSLARVSAALRAAGMTDAPLEMGAPTATVQQAAQAAGCLPDQIAKSVIFTDCAASTAYLFITAGSRQVDLPRASALAGVPLLRADAQFIRAQTGFAIGGVAPIGHLHPPRSYFDRRLLDFAIVWAAAGTPQHIFAIPPADLLRISAALLADFTAP